MSNFWGCSFVIQEEIREDRRKDKKSELLNDNSVFIIYRLIIFLTVFAIKTLGGKVEEHTTDYHKTNLRVELKLIILGPSSHYTTAIRTVNRCQSLKMLKGLELYTLT